MTHSTDDKNFRLSAHVRPTRYVAKVVLNLETRSFEGEERVEIQVAQPTSEVVLHALGLELSAVRYQAKGRAQTGTVRLAPESETAVLTFPEPLAAGEGALEISWRGRFNDGLRGLYLAEGVVGTQFEAADARRVFPCFDEPAFKARWALTVHAPADLVVLGNGAIRHEKVEGAVKRVEFEETEVLSSYLVALVAGKLVSTREARAGDVPVRTWTVPAKASLAQFGQDVALAVLPRLQEYFGLPYAFGKVDQVGLPEFEAGAMENAGLVTYRETALLADPKVSSLAAQKRVAEVVTHELAHQWFGNWVTMQWWDDLWLNEAFATWMAYKIVDGWRPDWRMWLDFGQGKDRAFALDALRSTHPVRSDVQNANEAAESFDAITYEKGGAVLRMVEGFLGADTFRAGIRAYMKDFARGNAVADDLWAALEASSKQPVVQLANAWIRQSGFPLVSVALQGDRVSLDQERYFSEPGVRGKETWPIPMVFRFADDRGVHSQPFLFDGAHAEVKLKAQGAVKWLCANADSTGFYRVQYDASSRQALAAHVQAISAAERISLLSDQWALVRSDRQEAPAYLELARAFAEEEDYAVLNELVGRLSGVEDRLTDDTTRPKFRAFVEGLWGAQLAKLGWGAPGETDAIKLRRAALLRAVGGIARSERWVQEARTRVDQVLAGDKSALEANLHDVAFSMAARAGDAALFDALVAASGRETDPYAKVRYLMSLTAFEAAPLVERAHQLIFSPTVPMQDVASFAAGLLFNRVGGEAFWEVIQRRWDDLMERCGRAPMMTRRVVKAVGNLRERRHFDQARAFLGSLALPDARQAVAQTLEAMEQDVTLRERAKPAVSAWL